MKKMGMAGAFCVLAILLAMSARGQHAQAVTATLRVQSATGVVGEVTPIDIVVSDMQAPGLGAWTVDIQYDPTRLSVPPLGISRRGCTAYAGGVCSMQYAANVGRFTGASATGLLGDVTLGTSFFRCLIPMTSPFFLTTNVLSDATQGNPQPIDEAIQNGSITCVEATPTSTALPATATPRTATLPSAGTGAPDSVSGWWLLAALLAAGTAALAGGAYGLRRRR